ncbi:hypothetical protein EG68_06487 [Paragonimus skrjabini miyazakii]|uniref:Uncharacterized protein n=1 Tax=Paragonimus skrjabini miyazakii TaxID=59628 RepID=A0A8S9YNS9_9TREM|nr:hypothetical protein EG68_06487 [Paragonimus skrjabini miyazakii]
MKEQAAIRIQSSYRGYRERKGIQLRKSHSTGDCHGTEKVEKITCSEPATTPITSDTPVKSESRPSTGLEHTITSEISDPPTSQVVQQEQRLSKSPSQTKFESSEKLSSAKQEEAATLIQAHYRGHLSRRQNQTSASSTGHTSLPQSESFEASGELSLEHNHQDSETSELVIGEKSEDQNIVNVEDNVDVNTSKESDSVTVLDSDQITPEEEHTALSESHLSVSNSPRVSETAIDELIEDPVEEDTTVREKPEGEPAESDD